MLLCFVQFFNNGKEKAMKIGIFGLPNSGKSQFRRWLVKKLRDAGFKAEHWDADCFDKPRCPEDEDMKEPTHIDNNTSADIWREDRKTIWLIEDVRGTMPHLDVVPPDENQGAWQPITYYDFILYLHPTKIAYTLFWVSRALQWKNAGRGDWKRETGWETLDNDEAIIRKVQYFLANYDNWLTNDQKCISGFTNNFWYFRPWVWTRCITETTIEWDFNLEGFIAFLRPKVAD
jgi:hypothetical protein